MLVALKNLDFLVDSAVNFEFQEFKSFAVYNFFTLSVSVSLRDGTIKWLVVTVLILWFDGIYAEIVELGDSQLEKITTGYWRSLVEVI